MSAASCLLPQVSGVYRSPPDPAAVQAGGAARASADLARVTSKLELLDTLAVALALPSAFGRNWDALADSLEDLTVPAQGWVLHLKSASHLQQALGSEWLTFLEILTDATLYWQERGRALVVFIDGCSTLPVWR